MIQSEWKEFGGKQYYLYRLYETNISSFFPSSDIPCYHGGPFLRRRVNPPNFIDIILNTGQKLISRSLQCSFEVASCFWCSSGIIGFVSIYGDISLYSLTGENIRFYSSGDTTIIRYPIPLFNGIAFLKGNVITMFDCSTGKYEPFRMLEVYKEPLCMAFVKSKASECFLCFKDNTIYSITQTSTRLIRSLPFSPTNITASPKGTFIAAWDLKKFILFSVTTSEFAEWVITSTFESVAFVDERSICAVSNSKVFYYCIPRFVKELPIVGVSFIVQDYDHIRIYCADGLYCMSLVPPSTMEFIRTQQTRTLFKALHKYNKGSIKCYQLLQSMQSTLTNDVSNMIEAALNNPYPNQQELILRSASFAMHAFDLNKNGYITTIRILRFMNTLRSSSVGFTTTSNSMQVLSSSLLIEFMMSLTLFEFAFRSCCLFDINTATVAQNWASYMFSLHGEKSLPVVIAKLESTAGVDYFNVAKSAQKHHIPTKSLITLSERIRNPKIRTDFIINIGQDPLPIAISLKDGSSIVTSVFLHKFDDKPFDFGTLLAQYPDALHHYAVVKKYIKAKTLCKVSTIDPLELMRILLLHEYNAEEFCSHNDQLDSMRNLIGPKLIWAKILKKQIKINTLCADNPKMKAAASSFTPRELVTRAIQSRRVDVAKEIANIYGISPRLYALVSIKAYASSEMWNELKEMVSKKIALKYEEIAEICLQHKNITLGIEYAKKINPLERRLEFFQAMEMNEEAEEVNEEIQKSKITSIFHSKTQK